MSLVKKGGRSHLLKGEVAIYNHLVKVGKGFSLSLKGSNHEKKLLWIIISLFEFASPQRLWWPNRFLAGE